MVEEQKGESQSSESESKQAKEPGLYTSGPVLELEKLLNEYLIKKAPFSFPEGVKEFIASVSPYLIIILAILALPVILAAIGFSAFLAPFAILGMAVSGHGWGFVPIVSLVVAVAVVIMELMAVPGLFKRTKSSWKLLFYASIVSLIGSMVTISGIVSGIIGALIGWYILFQVKELYKN